MTEKAAANPPKVSIVTTTYNQEAYVRAAFDSFVAQQTDFPVEIIVADDASTDATPAIIQEYASRYPHLFRPILRSENVGPHANLTGALSAARGQYIALCEGDDYWIDPLKLSKQVAFLDRHPETAVCFHPVRVIWTGSGGRELKFARVLFLKFAQVFFRTFPPAYWVDRARDLSVDRLLWRNFIQTNSVVYRRLPRYDDIPAVMPLDWYLHVLHAAHGDIAMLPETMAVYRRHPQGRHYSLVVDPAKFWLTQGREHVEVVDAMLDLFPGDPVREAIVGRNAAWTLSKITKKVPGPKGRALLLDTIAQHPRMAMLALQHRWAQTPGGLLKTLWRKLAAASLSRRDLRDVCSVRL